MIHCDNQSCIQMLVNPVFHDKTKHIEIRSISLHLWYGAERCSQVTICSNRWPDCRYSYQASSQDKVWILSQKTWSRRKHIPSGEGKLRSMLSEPNRFWKKPPVGPVYKLHRVKSRTQTVFGGFHTKLAGSIQNRLLFSKPAGSVQNWPVLYKNAKESPRKLISNSSTK